MKNDALKIIDSALKAASPYKNTFDAVKGNNYTQNVTVIAVGKAACPMAQAAFDVFGDKIKKGFVLTKYGHAQNLPEIFTVREAGHPVPDENSVLHTKEIVRFATNLGKDEKILFLLSGGGSSLFEMPIISLAELQNMTQTMLRSGADINEINAIRKLFSMVKGGKFASLCACSIDCLVLSDVLGDDPCTIASGPCCANGNDLPNGMDALNKYFGLSRFDIKTKRKIYSSFRTTETQNAKIQIIGNVESLCKGAENAARLLGYEAVTVTTFMNDEARNTAEKIIDEALKFAETPHKPTVFIYGGETTVTVKGNGKGGRNQEAALAAAVKLNGKKDILFFTLGSDGTDGPTDAAGGFAGGETYNKMLKMNIEPLKYLDNNDSYHALKQCGELLITGPTGTNVNDIFAVLIK